MYSVLTTLFRSELHYWPAEETDLDVRKEVLPTSYPEVPQVLGKNVGPGESQWEQGKLQSVSLFSEMVEDRAIPEFKSELNENSNFQGSTSDGDVSDLEEDMVKDSG